MTTIQQFELQAIMRSCWPTFVVHSALSPNKTLHRTAIPLRSFAAGAGAKIPKNFPCKWFFDFSVSWDRFDDAGSPKAALSLAHRNGITTAST